MSYFEGTSNLHYYTSCTLTTLHCCKVSFLQCCHIKRYNKIFTQIWGVYSLLWDTVRSLRRWFSILVLADSLLCTFCMSPLFNTPDSDHQLVRREIHELNWVFQIRETYKMCRAVGPMDQDWKPLAYATQVMISSVKQSNTNVTPCLHRMRTTWQNTKEVIIFSDAVYTGCCAARHISDRKLLPRSIYDVLTQISNDFQWSLYHVQCRQTLAIAVDTARYPPIRKKQSNLGVRSLGPYAPWVHSSAGKLIRYTSCLIVPQMFSSLVFYPPSLSFCRSAVHWMLSPQCHE